MSERPYCEDCGTRMTSGGICPNCHEELYIIEEQGSFVDETPFSEDFMRRVDEQRNQVRTKARVGDPR